MEAGGSWGGSSSYGDDKECFSPPGYSHGLMGFKPRPVPSTPCHRFQEAKCHVELWNVDGVGDAGAFLGKR